jgi:dolichol-phosphate mannosyltransferase
MTHVHDPGGERSVLVIVPTYNEAESLAGVLARLLTAAPHVNVLVADDGSPDGTGAIADDLAAADDRIQVMHRPAKAGLGAAYIAGFRWGLARGYDVLVEMDADGSHRPEDLPRLLDALDRADLVLGSRWVPGGAVVNWPNSRRWISRGGTLYAKMALGIHIRDATGGFRAFRRHTLEGLDLDGVSSQGYCFQIDLAWRAVQRGFTVVEVPITFVERELGTSKMSRSIVVEALWRVTAWGVEHRIDKARRWARGRVARTQAARRDTDAVESDTQSDVARRISGAGALTCPPVARRDRVEDRSEV